MMILNENHKLRHVWTKIFETIKNLQIEIHWFFIVTFVVNHFIINFVFQINMNILLMNWNKTYLKFWCCYDLKSKIWSKLIQMFRHDWKSKQQLITKILKKYRFFLKSIFVVSSWWIRWKKYFILFHLTYINWFLKFTFYCSSMM